MFIIEISERDNNDNRKPEFLELQVGNIQALRDVLYNLGLDCNESTTFQEFLAAPKLNRPNIEVSSGKSEPQFHVIKETDQ